MTQEMIAYYAQRAAEYERTYEIPRWQDDLAWIRTRLPAFFAGRRVFEVACATGYWTRYAAERARSVHAIDVNDDTLAPARAKTNPARVTFERRDAYAPPRRGQDLGEELGHDQYPSRLGRWRWSCRDSSPSLDREDRPGTPSARWKSRTNGTRMRSS